MTSIFDFMDDYKKCKERLGELEDKLLQTKEAKDCENCMAISHANGKLMAENTLLKNGNQNLYNLSMDLKEKLAFSTRPIGLDSEEYNRMKEENEKLNQKIKELLGELQISDHWAYQWLNKESNPLTCPEKDKEIEDLKKKIETQGSNCKHYADKCIELEKTIKWMKEQNLKEIISNGNVRVSKENEMLKNELADAKIRELDLIKWRASDAHEFIEKFEDILKCAHNIEATSSYNNDEWNSVQRIRKICKEMIGER